MCKFVDYIPGAKTTVQRILQARRDGRLPEWFTRAEWREACPGHGNGTYQAFLDKHRFGNPGGQSERFEKRRDGRFRLIGEYR